MDGALERRFQAVRIEGAPMKRWPSCWRCGLDWKRITEIRFNFATIRHLELNQPTLHIRRGIKDVPQVAMRVIHASLSAMKRRIAWLLAILSGLYLLIVGPLPDPLPIIDEATALLIFVKSMAYLGYDVRKLVPFLGRGKGGKAAAPRAAAGQTVDV